MKKIYLILGLVVCLFSSSCEDMLKEKTYAAQTLDSMLQNEQNIIRLVGQAYADIKWLHDHWGYWGISTLTADECVNPVRMPGGHWSDGGYWRNMNTHNWTPNDAAFKNVWELSIQGAIGCNKIIQILQNNQEIINPVLYGEYIGELEVLRTYYFYTLFDCFGRIPYTEEFDETVSVPLLEVSEVWHKLVECLERNAPNMKVVTNSNRATLYGRATQGFAYALLARLYLNAESYGVNFPNAYQKCVETCDKIIEAGSYQIEDDFFANFKMQNQNSRENIFVIVEDGNENFDLRNYGSHVMNKLRITMLSMHYSHQQVWNLLEKPWNGFCATPELIATYETGDKRGACPASEGTLATERWGWFIGPVAKTDGTILKDENGDEAIIRPEVYSLDSATWNDGARMWKFEIDKERRYKYCENDFPLFRYAEVLYMKQEAILRGGGGSMGAESADMDKIRTRAGVAAYAGALTLDELLNERGREFAWEIVRRRDLIRFGKYSENQQGLSWQGWGTSWRGNVNLADYRKWFPIPRSVLEKSSIVDGKNIWTQNEGY